MFDDEGKEEKIKHQFGEVTSMKKAFFFLIFFFLCRGRQYKNYVENSGVRELWEKRLIEAAEKWNPTLKRKNEV